MVKIDVGNNFYEVPLTWDEISVSKATKIHEVCKAIPECFKRKYEIVLREKGEEKDVLEWFNSLTDDEALNIIPRFQEKVLREVTGITEGLTDSSINNLYTYLCESFLIDLLYMGALYKPVKISSFKFDGVEYFPPNDKKILDVVIPMYNIKMIQFAEVSDMLGLIGREGYKFAPVIVATLCLSKGEIFNEDVILERSKKFEELPMSTVFDVFFYLMSSVRTLRNDSESYFHLEALKERRHKQNSITLGKALSWTSIRTADTYFSEN